MDFIPDAQTLFIVVQGVDIGRPEKQQQRKTDKNMIPQSRRSRGRTFFGEKKALQCIVSLRPRWSETTSEIPSIGGVLEKLW